MRIYDDHLLIWNPGNLPEGLSVEMLKKEHRSIPRNRLIAKVFFYAGLIEQWESRILKMISEKKAAGLSEPEFEEKKGFRVTFGSTPHATPQAVPHATPQTEASLSPIEEKVLRYCKKPRTRSEIVKATKMSSDYMRKELLPRIIHSGRLTYTLPETPRSPKQKYITKVI